MSPLVFKVARAVVPPIARVFCSPAGYAQIGNIESTNKILTIETVEFTHVFLGKDASIAELVDKIRNFEPHRSLWLAEGLGQVLGNRVMAKNENPRDVLTKGEGSCIPASMQLMVHAGLCLAFARYHFDKIGKNATETQIAEATRKIAELARLNLLPGYAGIGYEAWGMVTQFFYRKMFHAATREMKRIDPEHEPFLWHGAGRACYFIDFMPKWKEPWPAFDLVRRTAIDDASRHNLLAGLAAGMMIVNMKTPIILESIVKERISRLAPDDAAAFAQGVACSMVMRLDTTPGEENAMRFMRHKPAAEVAPLWEKIAAGPARLAMEKLHPLLASRGRLDEITRYRPLEELL